MNKEYAIVEDIGLDLNEYFLEMYDNYLVKYKTMVSAVKGLVLGAFVANFKIEFSVLGAMHIMNRIIKSMEHKYLLPSLELVENVFAQWDSPEEGKVVRNLVEEIRSKKYYIPELEFILVEGDPRNYNPRGFQPNYKFGVEAGPNVHLPHPDCLMIKELEEGALEHISGLVDYSFYDALHEGEK